MNVRDKHREFQAFCMFVHHEFKLACHALSACRREGIQILDLSVSLGDWRIHAAPIWQMPQPIVVSFGQQPLHAERSFFIEPDKGALQSVIPKSKSRPQLILLTIGMIP
jgi:hypothetical protein